MLSRQAQFIKQYALKLDLYKVWNNARDHYREAPGLISTYNSGVSGMAQLSEAACEATGRDKGKERVTELTWNTDSIYSHAFQTPLYPTLTL